MTPTTPSPADRNLMVIAERIRISAVGRGQLAATLGGHRTGQPVVEASGQTPVGPSPIASLFDEVVAAIARPRFDIDSSGVRPPPSRFMVRVAQVGMPARATKRNYNYFQELDAVLAERHLASPASPRGGPR
jgi:hypothetical protein